VSRGVIDIDDDRIPRRLRARTQTTDQDTKLVTRNAIQRRGGQLLLCGRERTRHQALVAEQDFEDFLIEYRVVTATQGDLAKRGRLPVDLRYPPGHIGTLTHFP